MKAYIEIRFVVDGCYVAGTHNKPIKLKLPKELLEEIQAKYKAMLLAIKEIVKYDS